MRYFDRLARSIKFCVCWPLTPVISDDGMSQFEMKGCADFVHSTRQHSYRMSPSREDTVK